MVGLDALPRWARENVVRLLPPADALHALPQVSEGVLAALIELNLPIGEFRASSVEAVVQQAHAPRRAWGLGTVDLSESDVRTLSALASCANMHTLNLNSCEQLTDV